MVVSWREMCHDAFIEQRRRVMNTSTLNATFVNQFDNAKDALQYIMAGAATITIVSKASGTRFTYSIQSPMKNTTNGGTVRDHAAKVRFVKLLAGPDNTSSYTYMGCIFNSADALSRTKKSRVDNGAKSWIAFDWMLNMLHQDKLPSALEIWHEGHCGRCNRKLTVPSSIANGIGPECIKHFACA